MNAYRVWAEIDLDHLTHNLAVVRRRAGRHVRVMLVVKADAYGHGAVAIAHHAVRCGISALGVGTSAEALALRRAGLRLPILVLGTIVDDEAAEALRHEIHIGLHSSDRLKMLEELARKLNVKARIHLNIDTGMGRLGVLPGRALPLLREIRASDALELRGVMTHVSSPYGALSRETHEQLRLFESVLGRARRLDLLRGWIHAANSAAIFTDLRPRYDTVRPGISAYGILPGELPAADDLKPVLSLRSQVVFLKDLPAGSPVGYSSTWRARRPARIATIPVGYNDGMPWRLSNRGEVLIRGQRAPIVGNVSMDYATIDVSHVPGVSVGDRVTLIGRDGVERISVDEVARASGTIAYEISCSVGERVERVYRGGEDVLPVHQVPLHHQVSEASRESAPEREPVSSRDTRGTTMPARRAIPRSYKAE